MAVAKKKKASVRTKRAGRTPAKAAPRAAGDGGIGRPYFKFAILVPVVIATVLLGFYSYVALIVLFAALSVVFLVMRLWGPQIARSHASGARPKASVRPKPRRART